MTDQRRKRALQLYIQGSFSPDIQGLRALAVVLVFAYHLFPSALPGGFVGVDVFFVISGYLITGLLLKDLDSSGSIALLDFYGRRVKRLLPAASAVLVAVAFLHPLLPTAMWEGLSQQITASALYYQNWWLGLQSVDYLTADTAPGPLQHFWSLAVEEQYYIAWPLLFFCMSLVLRRRGESRLLALALSVAIIFLISLVHSVVYSTANPEMAYFASTTRAWELALGGLLNFLRPGLIVRHYAAARLIGLAMIVASCFLISADSLFPGYVALLPTIGTSLIIICSNLATNDPFGPFNFRPVQYVGNVSYSLYLWHWPVIIFYGTAIGSADFADVAAMVVLALVLADVSKRVLEDPLRRRNYLLGSRWPLLLGLLCTGLSLLSAAWVYQTYVEARAAIAASVDDERYDGITPSPLEAKLDLAAPDKMGCRTPQEEPIPRVCTFGEENSSFHLVLVGDSHAMQWSPAFHEIAIANGWRFTLLTKSACTYAPILVGIGSPARAYDECLEWRDQVAAEIHRLQPSLVVMAQSLTYRVFEETNRSRNTERLVAAYAQSWRELLDQGIRVMAIRDTPRMTIDAPQCLTTPGNEPEDCFSKRASVLDVASRPDPLLQAAAQVPEVFVLDMSDQICGPVICPAVTDHLLIWRDSHHLTATFVKSLTPVIAEKMARALKGIEIGADRSAADDQVSSEALALAAADLPIVYEQDCFTRTGQLPLKTCEFGATNSSRTIALIGDSRAAQWSPALMRVALQYNLKLVTLLHASCPLGAMRLAERSCSSWSDSVAEWIEQNRPDILVISQSRGYRVAGVARGRPNARALADGFAHWLDSILSVPDEIFLLADTPRLVQNPLECLASATSAASLTCATRKEVALASTQRPDPLVLVAETSDTVTLIDLNDQLCPADGSICSPVIGKQIAWRTKYLLTATFSASMDKAMERLIFDRGENED